MACFCNLHNHSFYSLLDGKSTIAAMVERAKEMGQDALGIMDHGNCYGHVEFYDACHKVGIKPILGCEFYMGYTLKKEKDKNVRINSHMSVIAMNNAGLKSLNRLTARAASQFYFNPRITVDDLIEHQEGLIIFSGCFASLISQHALNDEDDKAIALIKKFKEVFGDRFYIEVQDSGVPGQPKMTKKLRYWSKKMDVKRLVTNDSHYVNKEDAYYHEVLLAINTNSKMSDKPLYEGGKRFAFSTDEYYMKDDKILEDEGWHKEEIRTTQEVAARCDVTIDKEIKIPHYPFCPGKLSSLDHLKEMLRDAWYSKDFGAKKNSFEYNSRVQRELKDIEGCDLADYFLITQHYIKWARDGGIETGDGRGSAAGSLISYMLGITNIDPMPYKLYWERFWNAGRIGVGLPDIDADFSQDSRGKVIDFIEHTFGKDRVLPVVSFGKMKIKGVLKDIGRTLGIPHSQVNTITSTIPAKTESFADAYLCADLDKWRKKYRTLFKIAEHLVDIPRHTSIHPSAYIILDRNVEEGLIPMTWDSKGKKMITGYDYHSLDKMNLLKADILGLKNLDILSITRGLVEGR
jgi:DNA polymerase-3 subunit alpha